MKSQFAKPLNPMWLRITAGMPRRWLRIGAETALYRTQTGEYAKGPDKIKSALEKFFAENKGIQVKAALFDLQLESANRANSQRACSVQSSWGR